MKKINKEKFLEEIIEKFDLVKSQAISYEKFMAMYHMYSNYFTEIQFADLLGIKNKTFWTFKDKASKNLDANVIILKNRKLSRQEELKIILELIEIFDLYKGKEVDYSQFLVMYNKVKKEFSEVEFANLLGISDSNLRNIRKSGKARLFRNVVLTESAKEEIRKSLIKKYEGKKIYYKRNEENKGQVSFLKLYKVYRVHFTEIEFAELLGISEKNLWYVKNNKGSVYPKIKDIEKIKKVEELSKQITEVRYYSKDEIDNLCKKVGLSIKDFINYYINKGSFFDSSIYERVLIDNRRLWIGKTNIKKADLDKYGEMFNRIIGTAINDINSRYGDYHLEPDFKSNMLIFIVYNCGDLIKNFQTDLKLMERMLWLRVRKYAKIIYICEYKKDIKMLKLPQNIPVNERFFDDSFFENVDLDNLQVVKEAELIKIFKNYLIQGYDKDVIIDKMAIMFNMKKTELLEKIKNYLLETKEVVIREDGSYEISSLNNNSYYK